MNEHPIASTMAPNPSGPLALANINLGTLRKNLVRASVSIREDVRPAGVNTVNEFDTLAGNVYKALDTLGLFLVKVEPDVVAGMIAQAEHEADCESCEAQTEHENAAVERMEARGF